ncbi:MAG: GLUG motif-containing protein, partial [Eubacterium sp.]
MSNYRKQKIFLKKMSSMFIAFVMIINCICTQFCMTVKAEEYTGYVYFTVEKITLGQGLVVEPVKVGFYKDDTLADITERVLGKMSTYEGDISSYYIESIIDGGEPDGWTKQDIPSAILEAAGGVENITDRAESTKLGAFDYYSTSGWMFSLNNEGILAGAGSYTYDEGDYTYDNGDVIRLQFSVYGYGQDTNIYSSSWGYGDPLCNFADKDELIKEMADYDGDKSSSEYKNAKNVLQDWDANAEEVKAAAGQLKDEEYSQQVDVKINMNAISTTMKLTDSNGNEIDIDEPENKSYSLKLTPGHYIVSGIGTDGTTVNGTIGIDVTDEENQNFTIWTVTAYCSTSGWAYGTDYTFNDLCIKSNEGVQRTDITLGTHTTNASYKTFLALNGDTYGFWFTPVNDRANDYAVTYQTGTVTSNANKSISAANKYTLSVTIPYEDENEDGINDYELEVGTLNLYYIYSYNDYQTVEKLDSYNENNSYGYDVEIYTYNIAKNVSYFYRVSNPYNSDAVTYGNYVSVTADSEVDVTKSEMYVDVAEGETDYDKDTVIDDLSVNSYDVADIYLNINEKGYLSLDEGDTYTLYPLRNWLAIEGISNAKVIEPDFHYTVLDLEGNVSDDIIQISENVSNTTSKHSARIQAVGEGTAVVLVTYDAMTNAQGMNATNPSSSDRTFFSAIWPENTGVFVVTVGSDSELDVEFPINEGKNQTTTKLSGNAIDAEHDVLYYVGANGADYTFEAEEKSVVEIARFNIEEEKYTGFTSDGVKYNNDGTITITGLTEGNNIVKVSKNNQVTYQIIRAKQTEYTITYSDSEGNELEADEVKAGDNVTIVFNKIYHPANKLSGYYNNTARIQYKSQDESNVYGTSNQYLFAATSAAQTVSFTIPKYWDEDSYNLTDGVIVTGGYGAAFGAHRFVTYEGGKPANFTATANVSYFCNLPDINIQLADTEFIEGNILIKCVDDGSYIDDYNINITDSSGNQVYVNEEGYFSALPGVYNYEIYSSGYMYKEGTFSIDESTSKVTKVLKVTRASEGAWDGLSIEEPEQLDGVYQIENGNQLAWFADYVNSSTYTTKQNDVDAILINDIDLAGYPWSMIGTQSSYCYSGIFDGNKKTISNLFIPASTGSIFGLFKYVKGTADKTAEIKNVSIDGEIKLTNAAYTAGSLVGYASSYTTISNCTSNVDILADTSATNASIGGIVGYTYGTKAVTTKVESCINNGNISVTKTGVNALNYVGGIIGQALGGSEISKCINNGSISGDATYTGGIAGYQTSTSSGVSLIYECANTGSIYGGIYSGGIVGYAYKNGSSALDIYISDCYNTGNITADTYSAGILGYVRGYSAEKAVDISNCYTSGNISAVSDSETANTIIAYAYNDYYNISNVYYEENSCDAQELQGVLKTETELKVTTLGSEDILTLLGDKFENDKTQINNGYPVLSFQNDIIVAVNAYDYTAVAAGLENASDTGVILESEVTVDYGTGAADIIEKAFEEAGITIEGVSSGYVNSINGLSADDGGGYSGWCFNYNNDDYDNWGISYITPDNGDVLRFDYGINADCTTDKIGNGWYGLPIVTEFELAGQTVVMSKDTTYDETWNPVTTYYINDEETSYEGTQENPFVFNIDVPYGTDVSAMEAEFTTSLNEHYQIISGIEETDDYSESVLFYVSSLGGKYVSYYKVIVTVREANGLSQDYQNIYKNVLKYIHNTVTNPTVSSIGGDWAAFDLAKGNYEDQQWYSKYYVNVINYVKNNGSAKLSTSKSTENSRVIIGLTSIGADVTDVGGYNLLTPLSDFDYVKKQGLNGAIYALIALDTKSYYIPKTGEGVTQTTRDLLIDYILDK